MGWDDTIASYNGFREELPDNILIFFSYRLSFGATLSTINSHITIKPFSPTLLYRLLPVPLG